MYLPSAAPPPPPNLQIYSAHDQCPWCAVRAFKSIEFETTLILILSLNSFAFLSLCGLLYWQGHARTWVGR